MNRIIQVIRSIVHEEMAQSRSSLLGVVTTVFPHEAENDENNYEVGVKLKHEDLELRRVPMAVTHMGVAGPPKAGDLVLVQFVNGDLNQPLVTGRFYHDGERPPLHHENELLFEHRLPDGTLNHLRFTDDGTIFLQRDVTKPEDNSAAKASVKIDGATGDIEIKASDTIVILLKNDSTIEITADGKPIKVTCDKLTINGNTEISGDLKVTGPAGSTTISGHEITGA